MGWANVSDDTTHFRLALLALGHRWRSTQPTFYFFREGGYSRNPVVRERTAAELLTQLGVRMEVHLKKAGSIEFGQIFDEVGRR